MKLFKNCFLFTALTILFFTSGYCFKIAGPPVLTDSVADSGIQISYTKESFVNLFDGIANILQNQIVDERFNSTSKFISLYVKKIDLAQLQLNKNISKTEFLADNKLRIILNFEAVNITFSYKLWILNILPIKDQGYFTDSNLQVKLDLEIKGNANGTTHFGITKFDLQTGNFEAHLNNKIFNFILKIVVNFSDFILKIFRSIIDFAVQTIVNKLSNSIPTQVKIPSSNGVIDLSLKGQPFLQNGYMNIPISGNSYIFGQTPAPLNPYRQFNPSKYGDNSTQIFIDEKVVNRLIQTFISNQVAFNATLPQVASSTTPVDSRSLSAVFPGLRKLKNIHYPVIEAILNSTSINFYFSDNKLKARAILGINLYMEEAKKPKTMFKYNNNIVYIVADVALNILNSKNFLTINLVDIDLQNVIVTNEDAPLVDVKQIVSIFPFFNQIVHDAVNLLTYQKYLDLSKLLGFDIDRVDINFEDNNIHLGIVF